ncbi:MAG: hypothetical protein ACQETH_10170 [Candidatus Rifleibacteriota bacterium]
MDLTEADEAIFDLLNFNIKQTIHNFLQLTDAINILDSRADRVAGPDMSGMTVKRLLK